MIEIYKQGGEVTQQTFHSPPWFLMIFQGTKETRYVYSCEIKEADKKFLYYQSLTDTIKVSM
jgi:hypothetical protein